MRLPGSSKPGGLNIFERTCFFPDIELLQPPAKVTGMKPANVHFSWRQEQVSGRFRTAVSLHSHTLHSKESLDFIPRYAAKVPFLGAAIERARKERCIDWRRAWWTPPLTPRQAFDVEAGQIKNSLQLNPLVSLTDHDNIEAPMGLRILEEASSVPVSVEWTVPCGQAFLHLGVHHLPPEKAAVIWAQMNGSHHVTEWLEQLHRIPGVLLIVNHPLWDEAEIGRVLHRDCLHDFLRRNGHFLHAFELNGLRPWSENLEVIELASSWNMPVISGGDRHAYEPNACLNLTNATSFAEFAQEVRDGASEVLFLPQYRQGLTLRVIHQIWEILREQPGHGLGWHCWSDRLFYRDDDDGVRSLREIWGNRSPFIIHSFVALVNLLGHAPVRSALRLLAKDEAALP